MRLSILYFSVVFLSFFTFSCKYEDGPLISLRSKKARVANKWKISKVTRNGDQLKGQDLADYMFGEPSIWEFTKDGKATFTYSDGTVETGTWNFEDSKKSLNIVTDGGDEETHKITKLKNNEMWLEDSFGSDKYVTYLVSA